MSDIKMRPLKPYLFSAHYEWLVDSDCTPYVLVETDWPGVIVPEAYVQDGRIVLSINPIAVKDFRMNEKGVFFSATFAGEEQAIVLPWASIRAIYAKENEQGTMFPVDDDDFIDDDSSSGESGKGHLRVVK